MLLTLGTVPVIVQLILTHGNSHYISLVAVVYMQRRRLRVASGATAPGLALSIKKTVVHKQGRNL